MTMHMRNFPMTDLLITKLRDTAVVEPCSDKGSKFLSEKMYPPYAIQRDLVDDFKASAEEKFGLEVEIK